MSKLTQNQIDELKILIQRYSKLDNEKEGIRILISETLGDYAEQIEEQFQDTIEEKITTSDFKKGVILDEYPYFLENHLNALQEDREKEDPYLVGLHESEIRAKLKEQFKGIDEETLDTILSAFPSEFNYSSLWNNVKDYAEAFLEDNKPTEEE